MIIIRGNLINIVVIFPAGDMFWARTEAIYQIFEIKFINKFPKELGQLSNHS